MSESNKKSKSLLRRFIDTFFSAQLEFRIRLFNLLAMVGTAISLYAAVMGIKDGLLNVFICLLGAGLSIGLITFATYTKRYMICYFITVIAIFLGMFPMLFFLHGGYFGSIPFVFILGIVFTVIMLQGHKALVAASVEIAIYVGLFVFAYIHPETVNHFPTDKELLFDISLGMISVGATLALTVWLLFRMYNEQQKKLDEQNALLIQTNRLKTEFLANASHEMRTPLTVISVNVQTVMEILEDMGETVNDADAGRLLQNAQNEIMRLSRMVGGMLTLASMSEDRDRQKLELSSLLQSVIDMLHLNLNKHGNTVKTNIETELSVFGNADLLAQVLTNILQNAGTYTENGTVTINAKKQRNEIIITVRDTGIGISSEILPRVFERGVSTDGTGYGLYLCKTIVESHGGKIWIESEPGNGATIYYTLPVYEGQFGGIK